jgi:dTDP-4-dehydrorhamnose 3,5-epimerase-like enzyme
MNVIETPIHGVLIIEPRILRDARGFFLEMFFAKVCATASEAAQDDRIVMLGVQPTGSHRIRLHPRFGS